MATHSSILAWEISWTEEPGGQQSTGLQRVRHDWACTHALQSEIRRLEFKDLVSNNEVKYLINNFVYWLLVEIICWIYWVKWNILLKLLTVVSFYCLVFKVIYYILLDSTALEKDKLLSLIKYIRCKDFGDINWNL